MKYATVCSGVEACSVAWEPLGFKPVFFSEIEPFPCRVLQHHYPNTPNLGDMNNINGNEYAGTIDLICGGTPCQSFSVAGLRKGMSDPRGNLALVFLRLVDQIRPRWFLWENVPGVLTSNKGRDFGSFLGALDELGYGWAYRVLDAQYFGVPQRRRRVFVVAHIGGQHNRSAAVLFEPECSVRGFAPGGKARQKSTGRTEKSASMGSGKWPHEIAPTLTQSFGKKQGITNQDCDANMPFHFPAIMATVNSNAEILHDKSPTLLIGNEQPILFNYAASAQQGMSTDELSPTLDVAKAGAVCVYDPQQITSPAHKNAFGPRDQCHTLHKGTPPEIFGLDQEINYSEIDKPIGTLLKGSPTGGGSPLPAIISPYAIRRLTPLECERLQGFPDNYTNIPGAKDRPRYAAMGNSMAVPVMRWIGERIALVDKLVPYNQ